MVNQSANFYGVLILLLGGVILVGLFTSGQQSATGFVVKDTVDAEKQAADSFFDVEVIENDPRTCADGSLNGECSSLIKPKFCLYGTLEDYCELCGCDNGEICSQRKCVKEGQK